MSVREFHCLVPYGYRGCATLFGIRVAGDRVVEVAHVSGRLAGLRAALARSWTGERVGWHLTHFRGFDPTEPVFGSAGGRWEQVR